MVGLHHIIRPLTSRVVAFNTVQASPGVGASARATPLPAAGMGATAAIMAKKTNRSLLMMDLSQGTRRPELTVSGKELGGKSILAPT
jgi:hypothetical protein